MEPITCSRCLEEFTPNPIGNEGALELKHDCLGEYEEADLDEE